jgi:hypothetical protein
MLRFFVGILLHIFVSCPKLEQNETQDNILVFDLLIPFLQIVRVSFIVNVLIG